MKVKARVVLEVTVKINSLDAYPNLPDDEAAMQIAKDQVNALGKPGVQVAVSEITFTDMIPWEEE